MNSTQKINVVTKIIVILALCRFIEIAQRISKRSDMQYTSLTLDKNWTVWYVEGCFTSTYTRVTNLQRTGRFLAHPVVNVSVADM